MREDKPCAACWVYTASTGCLAMLEWLVADPALSPRQAYEAVNALLEFSREECLRRGYGALFTVCRQPSLIRVYEKHGFIKTDEDVTSMLCPLIT